MARSKTRIRIDDMPENRADEITAADLNRIAGGYQPAVGLRSLSWESLVKPVPACLNPSVTQRRFYLDGKGNDIQW